MNGMLKVIAKFGGWEVVLDANSVVSIHFGNGAWVYDYASAYDAIKNEVTDPLVRGELLKQWGAHMNGGSF